MNLDKFLNLLATIFGTLGAIYVMMSIVAMTPDLMFKQTQWYWDYSVHHIEAIATQKADNMVGLVFYRDGVRPWVHNYRLRPRRGSGIRESMATHRPCLSSFSSSVCHLIFHRTGLF